MNESLLLRAVLAMDSYNRGPNASLNVSASTQIGGAHFVGDMSNNGIGFYGSAYSLGDEIVISYRGTNTSPSITDDAIAWAGGLGWRTAQAEAAAEFYNNFVGSSGRYGANITLTGHSLGGGLAGLMASLYGKSASVFDSMAFSLSANNVYYNATTPILEDGSTLNPDYQPTRDKYYGNELPQAVSGSYTSIQVSGQIIQPNTPSGMVLETGTDILNLGPIDRHSMSLLVILFYGNLLLDDTPEAGWQLLKGALTLSLFNNDIALAAGVNNLVGLGEAADKMRSMLAYTALNGFTPFGNTAVKALYGDVSEIAELVPTTTDESVAKFNNSLVEIATQYSALLGLRQSNAVNDLIGVATWDGSSVSMDLSAGTWANNVSGRIIGLENSLFNVVSVATFIPSFGDNLGALSNLFGSFTSTLINGLALLKATDVATTTLDGSASTQGAFLVGLSDGQNTFIGGQATNVMAGSGTNNMFDLSKGNNIVLMQNAGIATLDTSAVDDPITSQNWNMVQGTAGEDTFKFTGTEKAPLTIVYGDGMGDTYDFSVAQGAGASVYLLQMDDLNAQNFLSLDPAKIAEYLGPTDGDNDGNYYGGGANRIVIINPDQNDILKYNNEIIQDPTRYQKSIDHYSYKVSSDGDFYHVNPNNIFEYIAPYDPDSGDYGAYLTRSWTEYTDIRKEFSLKSGSIDMQVTYMYGGESGLSLNKIQSDLQTVTDSYDSTTVLGLINGRYDTETTTYYSEVDPGTVVGWNTYKGLQLTGFSNGDFGINIGSSYGPQTISDSTMFSRFVTDWIEANFDEGFSPEFQRWFDVAVGVDPKTFGATIEDYQEHYESSEYDYNAYILDDPDYQRQNLSIFDFKRDQSPTPEGTQSQRQFASANVPDASETVTSDLATTNKSEESSASPWKREDERVGQLREKGLDASGKPHLEQLGLLAGIAASQVPSLNNGHLNKMDNWQDNLAKNQSGFGDLGSLPDAGVKLLNVLFNKEEIRLFANAIPGTSSLQMSDGTTLLVSELAPSYERA